VSLTTCVRVFVLSLIAAPLAAQSLPSGTTAYDRASEITVAGTISGVDSYMTPDGAVAVHFDLDTGSDLVTVHLGPAMYIGQNNFFFLKDERVAVIGARVRGSGIWARAITKDGATLVLRNEDGTPRWVPAVDGTDGCGVNHAPVAVTTVR
jgi:hypothetical protein